MRKLLFTSFLTNMPWSRFGTELLLGKMTDKKAGYDALFLPMNLEKAIDKAENNGMPLVKSEIVLVENLPIENERNWFSPIIASILLIICALAVQMKSSWRNYFDKIFFVSFGLLALFIALMSVLSHHEEVNRNYVTLFFIPTIFLIPFFKEKTRIKIAAFSFFVIILAFLSTPFLPQKFNIAVLLLSVAIAIRCFFNFAKILKKQI